MLYETSHCPHCKSTIDYRRRTGINDFGTSLGHSIARCVNCNGSYHTGKKYWSDHDSGSKTLKYIQLIASIIITTLFWLMGLYMISGLASHFLSLDLYSSRVFDFRTSRIPMPVFYAIAIAVFVFVSVGVIRQCLNLVKLEGPDDLV